MSITTLTELQTAINDRFASNELTAALQNECIALTESMMRRDLDTTDMETVKVDFQIYGEFCDCPPNFNAVRSFMLNSSPRKPITFMPDDQQSNLFGCTGTPRYFCVVGKQFRFAPVPSSATTATIVYYQSIPSLATATPTNWMLTEHPDAYLYGALYQAAIRARDVDAATGYKAVYDQAIDSIQRDSKNRRWGGNGMAVQRA